MSAGSDRHEPHHLAAELGRRRGAIIALVTLGEHEDGATLEQLLRAARSDAGHLTGADLRWMVTVGLLRRESATGTWDIPDPAARYHLSQVGHTLASSLRAVAEALAAPACPQPGLRPLR
jgi:hypothetical protein